MNKIKHLKINIGLTTEQLVNNILIDYEENERKKCIDLDEEREEVVDDLPQTD